MPLTGKRVGVVLSSSFFGFYAHAGFLAALDDLKIRPVGYAGTSAGALVGACAASGLSTDEILSRLHTLKRADFWDPDYKALLFGLMTGFYKWNGLLKGVALRKLISSILPVATFEACPTPCCVIATDLTLRQKAIFKRGSLADAICASGTVPGLFQPYQIDQHLYVDGGIVDKAPVLALHDLVQPDILIVHYLRSSSLEREVSLETPYLPLKLNRLTRDLSREVHYQTQLRTLAATSCRVIEIPAEPPRVSPFSLGGGLAAYEHCRKNACEVLTKVL